MNLNDLSGPYRSAPTARQLWRWLVEFVWRIEHAFERSRAKERPVDDARLRIFLLLALFTLAFCGVAASAGEVALFAKTHFGLGVSEPNGARATLEDRNGLLLATDLPSYDLYLAPRDAMAAGRDETRDALLRVLPRITAERIDAAFASGRRSFLIGGLTPAEKAAVHDLGRPGLDFEETPRRFYPLGTSAAHLIGYTQTRGDGLAGAEHALDAEIQAAGAAGQPVQLSIDLRVQAALEDELDKAAGRFQTPDAAGIVVDVHSGEILAMASYPTFDPNNLHAASPEALRNHVAGVPYEAGSVFKVFTLAAGLDTGAVTPASTFDVSHPLIIGSNRPIHDFDKGDTSLTLPEVFTHSSNIGASHVAMAVGGERMDRYMRAFGLYAAAPSELAESTRPLPPHRGPDGRLDPGVLAYMSFGQGLSVTPLQIATGMTSIFNGGTYIPLTIRKLTGAPPQGRRVVSEHTAQTLLDFMRRNVTDPKGSGKSADVPGLSVGGKTGTAQKAGVGGYKANARVASFAAVFPTAGKLSDRRYLVYILLDEPKPAPGTFGFATAGFTAAPTAGAVINRIAPFLGVMRAPAAGSDPETIAAAAAPPAAPTTASPSSASPSSGAPISASMGAD
jgi:cell division protein FtsI (penicillin-binding protein 3)